MIQRSISSLLAAGLDREGGRDNLDVRAVDQNNEEASLVDMRYAEGLGAGDANRPAGVDGLVELRVGSFFVVDRDKYNYDRVSGPAGLC